MAASMQDIDRLLNTLRNRVPGVTDAVMQLELFNAIDDHLRRTNAYRWDTDIQLQLDSVQFPIFPPGGTTLVRILTAEHNGFPVGIADQSSVIDPIGKIQSDLTDVDGGVHFDPDVTSSPGGVFQYSVFFPQYLTLTNPPSVEAVQFPFRIVMSLTLDPVNLEDDARDWPLPIWMFARYFEDWINGAQARIYSMASKPWTNDKLALMHLRLANRAVAMAKQESDRGFAYNTPSWRFPGGWV